MATKQIGYVELEWQCPKCGTRNPGTQESCSNCGAPQPADVKFEAPLAGELLKDQAKIARAEGGPDIVCGFCGTRNQATAKNCKQCGAELAAGKARQSGDVVAAAPATPSGEINCQSCGASNPVTARTCKNCGAALTRPKTQAAANPLPILRASGFRWVAILLGALLLVGLGYLIYQSSRSTEISGTVREAHWRRMVLIEQLMPVRDQAWADEVPANAEVGQCTEEVHHIEYEPTANAREVCDPPYTVDTGTGVGKVVQECHYEVYADMCSYTTLQWRQVDSAMLTGSDFAPAWPTVNLGRDQRQGGTREEYQCTIAGNDQLFTYTPASFAEYQTCKVGQRFSVAVNGLGNILSIQPVP